MTESSSDPAGETLVPEDGSELSFRGDIRGSGTPKILRTILQSGESGVLSFSNGVVTKTDANLVGDNYWGIANVLSR